MFFWPNAYSDVNDWIRSCKKCNTFNSPPGGYVKAPLTPIITTNRFELVCYDLAGPFLPATIRSNRYVLIIADHFSHWPEFFPLPDINASPVLFLISGVVDMEYQNVFTVMVQTMFTVMLLRNCVRFLEPIKRSHPVYILRVMVCQKLPLKF